MPNLPRLTALLGEVTPKTTAKIAKNLCEYPPEVQREYQQYKDWFNEAENFFGFLLKAMEKDQRRK
jgi:hypothetical protein